MGEPCGKCGSKSTYSNYAFSSSGSGIERGCLMCGWRSKPLNPGKVIRMPVEKKSNLVKYGTCVNCKREGITLICKDLCSGCYQYRKSPEALQAAAARLVNRNPRKRGKVKGDPQRLPDELVGDRRPRETEPEPYPETQFDGPVLQIVFSATDVELFDGFLKQAKYSRRTPENHILYLVERDVREAEMMKRESAT